jgi:transcriptional regulator with XRE-family HTH domain
VVKVINNEKEQIGIRVRQLRELLSLTRPVLAAAVGMTSQTLMSIESGKGFTGDYILAISHFFGMELSELASYKNSLPDESAFRNRIKAYHKKNKSDAYKILDNSPTLKALIEFRLVKSDFLKSKPRSVREIMDYFKEEYKLRFKSSVVSQGLITAVNTGILEREKEPAGRNFLYRISKNN